MDLDYFIKKNILNNISAIFLIENLFFFALLQFFVFFLKQCGDIFNGPGYKKWRLDAQ